MDRKDLAQVFHGAIALLAASDPTEEQVDATMLGSVDAAFKVWNLVHGTGGDSQRTTKAPDDDSDLPGGGKVKYMDPETLINAGPPTMDDLREAGLMPSAPAEEHEDLADIVPETQFYGEIPPTPLPVRLNSTSETKI